MSPNNNPVVLSDFVNSVPSPLTFALVSLSDKIALLKTVLQVLNWRSNSWFDGFLVVAAWWAFCCFAGSVLRYFLPVLVVGLVAYTRKRGAQPTSKQPVVTETLLQNTISDLTTLPILLPDISSPALLVSSLSLSTLARAAAVLYIPYLALTYYVPLYLIFAIAGTVVLTWRAPFAMVLRKIVWRSAYVRWTVWTAWSYVSGVPLPPKAISPQTQRLASTTVQPDGDSSKGEEGKTPNTTTTSLRFLFTVYENQRWWMGLDWTAALLPGERPSWCSASQAPLSPPGAFTLPEPTTTYIPHPSDSTKKIKRTAEWYWEEPEWRVLVKKEGTALSRVERPVPTEDPQGEDGAGGGGNNTSSRLLKAASNRFASGSSSAGSIHRRDSSASQASGASGGGSQDVVEGAEEDTDSYTDPDGWVYGDNKWENKSNKGGMSKYTRYRRWTRVAVLTEFTQVVDAAPENTPDRRAKPVNKPPPISLDGAATGALNSVVAEQPQAPVTSTSSEQPKTPVKVSTPSTPSRVPTDNPLSPGASESPLRQRLRMALNKGSAGLS
ncbi:hypothetical protein CC1G_07397 [Coprinopsis cinerea okayama7|uniref:TECPR1-like DysF domain-containing protein n=1 Tax=Coprinopsis cinerea (strain Okayama-7 / 130 / ATCC MYA-4618 / FGSC 9003) TaxID=240176 RepID=A8N6M6_COPC7|nr:hypothetical protein CC1G_07397 [Coprinopsis cinerea okayama7\|eukprot:XP_001830482.1 hypothetical protein CC1G_07397 [Coprinopsis cinerea okayama7\